MHFNAPAAPPAATLAAPRSSIGYRWRLLAVLWFIVAVVVALPSVGSGVLNARMITELKLDRGVYGAAFGLFVVMMGVPAPLVAAAVRRWGVKPVITAGCAMAMLGSLLIATVVQQGWQFALAFGLLVGGGVSTAGVLPAQAAVTRWFVDKRALAVSIALSAVDIGGIIGPPVLESVVSDRSWRAGWLVIAALAGIGMVAAWVTLRREAGDEVNAPPIQERHGQRRVHKTERDWTVKQAWRTRAFWGIAIFSAVVGMDWILFMAHGVVHLRDIGFSSALAARAVSVMVSASLVGNMAAGLLGDRIPPHRIAAIAMACVLVGLLLAIHPQGPIDLWAFAVPMGLGYGASQVCLMALLGNYYGARAFATLFGMLLAVGTVLAAVLAGAAGAVFEQFHTYNSVFHLCAVLTGIATLAISLAGPPKESATQTH
jgi:MFS family permease